MALFFLGSWLWKSEDLLVGRFYLATWGKRAEVEREGEKADGHTVLMEAGSLVQHLGWALSCAVHILLQELY